MLRAIHQTLVRETRLAAVVTQADDPIWTKTVDGVITSWNRAAHNLLGWHSGEVIGQSVYRIMPPDLHDQERAVLERLRKGERVEHYRTARLARDGRRVELEVSISPVRDATGQVIAVGSIAREVET
jgi:PAS domain S-box-containing protein